MTEAEWLACTDAQPMLDYLRGKAGDRKLRLFACACCRRVWQKQKDERIRQAEIVTKRYADGRALDAELHEAWDAAWAVEARISRGVARRLREVVASRNELEGAELAARLAAAWAVTLVEARAAGQTKARAAQRTAAALIAAKGFEAALLRDISGNPFRKIAVDPAWLAWNGGSVLSVAKRIDEEPCFEDIPVLADALEEAGCDNADLLAHCREPGEHVRGCWVIDLLLGKA